MLSSTDIVNEHVKSNMKSMLHVIEAASKEAEEASSSDAEFYDLNTDDSEDEMGGLGPARCGAVNPDDVIDEEEFADFLASESSEDCSRGLLHEFLGEAFRDLFVSEEIAFSGDGQFLAWHRRWMAEEALAKFPAEVGEVYPFFEGVVSWHALPHGQFAGWQTYNVTYLGGKTRVLEFPATWSEKTMGSLWFCANPCLAAKTLLFSNQKKGEVAKDIAESVIEGCYEHIRSLLRL